jgi:hypothetical protein
MTEQEKKIIGDYNTGTISKESFLKNYPFELNEAYVYNLFHTACKNKNAEEIDYGIMVLSFVSTFENPNKYVDILNDLLKEDWHYKHEDIVLFLQELKSPTSIDALYSRALVKPSYMDYDDTYSLARKCIHALGDINTDYSREKLMQLASSDIPVIKEKAEKQLFYYKR